MIFDRAVQARGHDRGEADGSGTDHNHHVADLHLPVLHADLVAGGQDVGEHRPLLRRDGVREWIHRCLRERNPHVLGLGAVDEVAEDPPDAGGALVGEAVREHALLAHVAVPARADTGDDDAVAGLQRRHGGTDFGDGADALVAQDAPVLDCGHVPLENVQVGAADGGGLDLDDDVGGLLDGWIRYFFPRLLARTVVDHRLHDTASVSLGTSFGSTVLQLNASPVPDV